MYSIQQPPQPSYVTVDVYSWFAGLSDQALVKTLPPPPAGGDREARLLGLQPINLANNWKQEEDLYTAYTIARLSWDAENEEESRILARRFRDWIGYDVIAQQGNSQVWSGKIWAMTWRQGYSLQQISLDNIANYIAYDYSGGSSTASDSDSINRWGQIERYLDLSDLDATSAANRAAVELQMSVNPSVETIALYRDVQPYGSLEIVCHGYLETGRWQAEPTTTVGAATAISTVITNLLTNDFANISIGNIATNSETIATLPTGDPLQVLVKLVKLGGTASGGIRPLYRLRIEGFNTVYYEHVDNDPVAYLTRNGMTGPAGQINTRFLAHQAPLGVIRDELTYVASAVPGSWFEQSNDMLANYKIVSQGDLLPTYRRLDINDADLYAAAYSEEQT